MRQKRNGCPDLPSPPSVWVSHNSYDGSHDDPGYATVREFRQPLMASTPRVRLLQAPDDGIVRFGSHKYENVLRPDLHAATVSTVRALHDVGLYVFGEERHHATLVTRLRYDPDMAFSSAYQLFFRFALFLFIDSTSLESDSRRSPNLRCIPRNFSPLGNELFYNAKKFLVFSNTNKASVKSLYASCIL